MDLFSYNNEFLIYVQRMWTKIVDSSIKHKNDSMEYNSVKDHYIEEILECFNLRGTTKGLVVQEILREAEIDEKELPDVSNMAFAMAIAEDLQKTEDEEGQEGKHGAY